MRNLILIVLIFLTIIYLLIYNLINVNKKIDSYFEINNQISEIVQINRDLYQFSVDNIKFNNYDNIKNKIDSITYILKNITDTQKYPLIKDSLFYKKSLEINEQVSNEIEIIEKLKSYNAIFNNSIRNLKILKSRIKNSHKYDEIYNKVLTINYGDNLNLDELKIEINKYKPDNEIETIFLSHVNILFEYFIKKQISKQNIENLDLINKLKSLHEVFEEYMQDIIKNIMFTIIIFILLLIISILLFIYYAYNVLKNKIELDKLKNALDISDNIIVITDINHNIKYVNHGFQKVSGYSSAEVIGKKPSILSTGLDNQKFYQGLRKTIHSGEKWNGEFINKNKFGEITYEKSSITPIKNSRGEIVEFLAVKLDVTKEKKYQNILMQQSKMASMGELLENIAHQWRQPLSIISSISSGALIQQKYNSLSKIELEEFFSKIFDTTQKLSKTIDDLKNFFENEEEIVTFKVGDSLEKAINLFSIKVEFNNIDIEYNKNINTLLTGKENEFVQTILNILNNSLDTFITNKIEKKVIKISTNQNSETLQIKISDNAGGVDEGILEKIFELYFTTKHKAIGTGVGLYMAYQIITHHFNANINAKNSLMTIDKKEYKGLSIIINIPIN